MCFWYLWIKTHTHTPKIIWILMTIKIVVLLRFLASGFLRTVINVEYPPIAVDPLLPTRLQVKTWRRGVVNLSQHSGALSDLTVPNIKYHYLLKSKHTVETVQSVNVLAKGQGHLGQVNLFSAAAQESWVWDLPVPQKTHRMFQSNTNADSRRK